MFFTVNEFNENKLKRFGEDFLTIVRSQTKGPASSTSFQKKSILDILSQKPLCNAMLSPTASNTYSSYKKGFTIKEISEQRCVVGNTLLLSFLFVSYTED